MTTLTASPSASATASSARPAVRTRGASTATLVGLEVRKSLSTRSGKTLALASALLAPATAAVIALTSDDDLGSAAAPIGALGLVTVLVLLSLGVLSSAGEWTHRTVQTTFLAVPHRGRVVAAKAVATALLGAGLAAVATAATAGVLAVAPLGDLSWDGVPRAIGVVVAAGAAFAVIGAGVGAAVGNSPAALTGLYLTVLGVMPVLRLAQPGVAEKLDPADAMLGLALGSGGATQVLVLAGWVVVSTVAGAVVTGRRAVA
jgi:ABC-2 type transport system permease protein